MELVCAHPESCQSLGIWRHMIMIVSQGGRLLLLYLYCNYGQYLATTVRRGVAILYHYAHLSVLIESIIIDFESSRYLQESSILILCVILLGSI